MKSTLIYLTVISCFTINLSLAEEEYAPVIQLRHGKIRGVVRELDGLGENDPKRKIHLYQGFRFARAERFSKPKPVTSWPEEVYDATTERNTCPQFVSSWDMSQINQLKIEEDCLFLNVYKPVTESSDGKLLPVMFWIYGGGFQTGSIFSKLYDCSYIAAIGEVIVVSVNYRLGPLGFLYGGTEDAPGNQGLHDQLMGLKWVKDNIDSFGGDPNQITVFGVSAGSISVSSLILSPLSKGLFNRAILQSGALSPQRWVASKSKALERTNELAQKLKCQNEDNEKVIECLKSKSLEEIIKVADVNQKEVMTNTMHGPILGDEFLPESAKNFVDFNQVDLIFGVTRDEGGQFSPAILPEIDDDNAKLSMERIKESLNTFFESLNVPLKEEITNYYTKNLVVSDLNQIREVAKRALGDSLLTCPTFLFGKQMFLKSDKKHSLYAYRFDRRGPVTELMRCKEWMGTCHGGELVYQFILPFAKMAFKPEDFKFSHDFIKAWANFAKTGKPGLVGSNEWKPAFEDVTDSELSANVMALDIESKMVGHIYKETCDIFWEKKFWNSETETSKPIKNDL